MKIIHIIGDLRVGGAEVMLYKLLSHMNRRRFDSLVISLIDRGSLIERFKDIDVPIHIIGMKPGRPTPASFVRLARKLHELKPSVIQGWMYHGNLAAQLSVAVASARVPVLWNVRGSHYSLKDERLAMAATIWLTARLSGLPAKIINNSVASALGHEQNLGYRADKRVIIPNGFDTSRFVPSAEARRSVRAELGVAEDTLLIAMIARFHPVKNHTGFLQASSLLLQKHPGVHFVLAGKGIDNTNGVLNESIKRLGISEQVHLLGERADMPRLSAAMDIVSLTSHAEGFPNVIGEAMSCGVPCAVTDVGDSAEILGNTGRVTPPGDVQALAKAWQELIEMGAEHRLKLGELARQRVIDNFSLDAIARQYETVYEDTFYSSVRTKS